MMNNKPIETEKKSNKACLVVTITIVVLLNLGVYFYYDEISQELSYQYDKYFGDEYEDLIITTTMMTLNSNKKDSTIDPEIAIDPTEAATTTTTEAYDSSSKHLTNQGNYILDLDDENTKDPDNVTDPTTEATTTITIDSTFLSGSGVGAENSDDEDYNNYSFQEGSGIY